ncbi:MAG: hypothetical protein AAF366_06600 [Pseudomonadota bacterium]
MDHGKHGLEAEMFSLSVQRDGDASAPVLVPRATILRPGFRHRLTFTSQNRLADVLDARLVARIAPLMAEAFQAAPTRIDRPTDEIALPGLILGGLTLTVGRPRGDRLLANLKFKYFIGGLQTAFAARTGFDRPTLAHREALGLRALDDVARPLLDMAGALSAFPQIRNDPSASDGMAQAMAGVEAQAADLEFYAGLLRRYVRDCDPSGANRFEQDPVAEMSGLSHPPLPAFRVREDDA